jgi:hypothetical protein
MATTTPVVLADLDSTLSNTTKRAHLARPGATESDAWIEYSRACITDEPIAGPVAAIRALSQHYPLFIVSGRNVEAYGETVTWLRRHDIHPEGLRLRASGDIQDNADYKVDFIEQLRRQGFEPFVMFEDQPSVADKVEAAGVPVVRVNPGYEDTIGVRVMGAE